MSGPIDFERINAAALRTGRSFVESLIPGGKFRSLEYVVKNPCRDDRRPGSLSINYRSGLWKDFSSGHGGADPISLVAYVRGVSQGDAARELASKLGVPLFKSNGAAASTKHNRHNNGSLHNGADSGTAPKIHSWGDEGPPSRLDEMRRHAYSCDGCAMRIKIKLGDGGFINWYRVFSNGVPIGWQAKKPDGYNPIPYVLRSILSILS
jgi:hypothetical protein